jgi:hypothetical protein
MREKRQIAAYIGLGQPFFIFGIYFGMSNRSVSASRFVSEAALALAQESDPDRFFCAMFLPEPARAAAFTRRFQQ